MPADIPDPQLDAGWESDLTSVREDKYWPEYGEIGKQKNTNTLAIHKAIGLCIPVAIVVAFTAFLISCGIYLLHLLAPESWKWLSDARVDQLHNMLFSGIVGAAVTQGARVYLGKNDHHK